MRPIITVDGPSGGGKSTAASGVARALGWFHLDTGAMYRAVAWKSLRAGLTPSAARRLGALARQARLTLRLDARRRLRVMLDGRDVTSVIRTAAVSARASEIAVIPAVRRALVAAQRRIGRRGRVVAEGRDTGTVVFPAAAWKFYVTASVPVRARRRWRDLRRAGATLTYAQVLHALRARDRRDTRRADSPLRRAAGAIVVDTSRRTPRQTIQTLLRCLKHHPIALPWRGPGVKVR
ncbi:MAG: (d)CMP kinase [Candidatus Omnitrophica bacterium]|nr:(d)CMP kinase [Candidatus Omnitrophota bacterium]